MSASFRRAVTFFRRAVTFGRGIVTFGLALVLAGAAGAQGAQQPQLRKPVLWWNDATIVQEIGLTDAQRHKMDAAWAAYEKKLAPIREARSHQQDFAAALEKGDYAAGRQILDKWISADQSPRRAMAELKLDILPQLNQAQREKLLQSYPRLIRRNWAPAIVWTARPPAGGKGRPQGPGHGPGGPARP